MFSFVCKILADSLKANDPKTSFDVLWEIESFPLFLEAGAEELARDAAAGDEKEKKKDKKSKDKDKDKKSKVCVCVCVCVFSTH